ncbi:homoserine O-succinyltransferase MetX [Marilutibacter chinensis]|uniref:Homoserine O-succinyltransferase n=1 Tax=Marilutibacter chinensis TaxID=2912247 RepID=A0ABS9HUZ6_9GAMM|nr:homoserine O-succinyltransferase [Lysobacter chinensis]MCF7222523.1 homoserine O-succinyltransferase [Lysobacter chinensis]
MSLTHSTTASEAIETACSLRFDPRGPACDAAVSLPQAAAADAGRADAVRGEIEVTLDLRHAGPREVLLRYEIQHAGGPENADAPVVFVAGGISANRHLAPCRAYPEAGWWPAQVGEGRAIDPRRCRIVSFDWLGADGRLDVPLDPADQATAIVALLDALDIGRIETFIGSSYGAMVGLQLAALHGARLGRLVAISGVHRAHPYASAWRALQRRAVALGSLQCDETHGLALARQFAILSYRTPEEFDARFAPPRVVDGRVRVGAEDYLDHCAARFVGRSSPTAYVRLSESIDLQAVDPSRIGVPVTVVAVAEDRLVPLADAHALVEGLRRGASAEAPRLHVLSSPYGHDAFLKEEADIDTILRDALSASAPAANPNQEIPA